MLLEFIVIIVLNSPAACSGYCFTAAAGISFTAANIWEIHILFVELLLRNTRIVHILFAYSEIEILTSLVGWVG